MKKIVLTGAPHSGKSTLAEELLEKGHLVVPETAITVIESLNELLGLDGALRWRRNHFEGFQELISERQWYMETVMEDQYHQAMDLFDEFIFLDRGAHDGIAFARHFHKKFPEKASKYIEDVRYDQVFLLDLVTPFDDRNESGRIETEEDCRAIQKHLKDVYTELGLEPILVPLMPVEDRLHFILERI